MTEEQIKMLNEKCICLEIDEKNIVTSFNLEERCLYVRDFVVLRKILKDTNNKDKIKLLIILTGDFLIEDFREFRNLTLITYKGNLSLSLLYKILDEFPKIEELYFETVDMEVYEIYENLNIKIKTSDPKYKLSSSDKYLKYCSKFETKKYGFLEIHCPFNEKEFKELFEECKEFSNIAFSDGTIEEYERITNYIKEKGIKIKKIYINLENKDYENIDKLKKLETNESTIYVSYNGGHATIEEFKNMRASLNYYVELIRAANLSPVEQVMYAYDIVKSIPYKEKEEAKSIPRKISGFISEGFIVCVGYVKLMSQILKELRIEMFSSDIACYGKNPGILSEDKLHNPYEINHVRGMIRIDDDKYNIHGVFVLDPTADRNIEEESGLDYYNCFLVPLKGYRYIFKHDSFPILYSYFMKKVSTKKSSIFEELSKEELEEQLKAFFGSETSGEEYERIMNPDNMTPEQFKKMLRNVRKAEGYPEYMLDEEVDRVAKLNGYISTEVVER